MLSLQTRRRCRSFCPRLFMYVYEASCRKRIKVTGTGVVGNDGRWEVAVNGRPNQRRGNLSVLLVTESRRSPVDCIGSQLQLAVQLAGPSRRGKRDCCGQFSRSCTTEGGTKGLNVGSELITHLLCEPDNQSRYELGAESLEVRALGGVLCGGIKTAGCGLVKWDVGTWVPVRVSMCW